MKRAEQKNIARVINVTGVAVLSVFTGYATAKAIESLMAPDTVAVAAPQPRPETIDEVPPKDLLTEKVVAVGSIAVIYPTVITPEAQPVDRPESDHHEAELIGLIAGTMVAGAAGRYAWTYRNPWEMLPASQSADSRTV